MSAVEQIANCNGTLMFSPPRPGLRKTHRSFENAVIVKIDNGISQYYSWWIKKKLGLELKLPMWGAHVTVVSDKDRVKDVKTFQELKEQYNKAVLTINHKVKLVRVWHFWVLNVVPSNEMVMIRKSLGLPLDFPYHITIGRDDA